MTCKHRNASLVYVPVHEFVAYQCDACGLLLRRDVPAEAIDNARTDLPHLDDRTYTSALAGAVRRIFRPEQHTTVRRMAAMKRK